MSIWDGHVYPVPWDKEATVAASEIRNLTRERQFRLVRHWFYQMFEDPWKGSLHGAEGRYSFNQGGPCYADDEITNEFITLVDERILEKVIAEVQEKGPAKWIPSSLNRSPRKNAPDALNSIWRQEADEQREILSVEVERVDVDARTSFGTSFDSAVRVKVQERATDLKVLLEMSPARQHGGMGHNQPPSDAQLEKTSKEKLQVAAATISEELKLERPDVLKVSRAAQVLRSIGHWTARKLEMSLDAFLNSLASTLGIGAASAVGAVGLIGLDPIIRKAMELYLSVLEWLNAVVIPL